MNYQHGKKGFSPGDGNVKNVSVLFLVDSNQKKIINDYCQEEKISMSDMIRDAIFEYLERRGVNTRIAPPEDKRQLKLYDNERQEK